MEMMMSYTDDVLDYRNPQRPGIGARATAIRGRSSGECAGCGERRAYAQRIDNRRAEVRVAM